MQPTTTTQSAEPEPSQRDDAAQERIRRACTRFLGHHYPQSPRDALLALAEEVPADAQADMYGKGDIIESFEARVADLLGKQAAVFMPSGTMCQQIALRVWTDRRGINTVAMHPRNHLEGPEKFGYQRLHGLTSIHIGHVDAIATLADLQAVAEPIGALLLELPQREIGGVLPEWDDLVAMTGYARERGIPVHMDGARLWESQPFYDRSHATIAGLFDSVYVSFYKGLGGITGAALAGPADIIAEARVWQRRHGGNLIRLYPYIIAAQIGLDRHLHRMGEYAAKARAIAEALHDNPDIIVTPDPPQTNMMHLFLRGSADGLRQAFLDVAEASGVWLFNATQPAPIPGFRRVELSVGEATLDLPDDEIVTLLTEVIQRATACAATGVAAG